MTHGKLVTGTIKCYLIYYDNNEYYKRMMNAFNPQG